MNATKRLTQGLDKTVSHGLKYRQFPAKSPAATQAREIQRPVYDSNPVVPTSREEYRNQQCKHPRVQIVAREEDAEFVECLECGEIFESSEFKDMAIEDTKLPKNEF